MVEHRAHAGGTGRVHVRDGPVRIPQEHLVRHPHHTGFPLRHMTGVHAESESTANGRELRAG